MMIKVYFFDTAKCGWEDNENSPEFRRLCASLSGERQQKICRFRFAQGRFLSLGAGLLLDYGLRRYGLRESEVAVGYRENGKPYLPDYPEIHFNLSHSGSIAMAVFAEQEAGCDIEQIGVSDLRVARRFFAVPEQEKLEAAADLQESNEWFYRFWTLKESFIKATGKGMQMPLNEFCIHMGPPITVEAGGEWLDYGFQEFVLPGYKAAICVHGMQPETSQGIGKAEAKVVPIEDLSVKSNQ